MCSALIFRLSEEEDDVYREWKRGKTPACSADW
jgi:hypothetical protein